MLDSQWNRRTPKSWLHDGKGSEATKMCDGNNHTDVTTPGDVQPIMMCCDRGARLSVYEGPTSPEGASRVFDG